MHRDEGSIPSASIRFRDVAPRRSARRSVLPGVLAVVAALGLTAHAGAQESARRIDLQAALDRGGVIQLPPGTLLLERHVRISKPDVRIECPGGIARLVSVARGAERDTPIVDATGAYGLQIENVQITTYGDADTTPVGAGLYLGRDAALSPMQARLANVAIHGKFRVAALVNTAGEASTFEHCDFRNLQPGGHAVLLAGRHPSRLPVRSSPQPQTCLQNTFVSCSFAVNDPFSPRCDGSACLAIESLDGDVIGDVALFGGGFSAKQPGSYGLLIRCQGRGGHVNAVNVYGLRAECNEAEAVIRVDQPEGQSAGFVTWDGGSIVFAARLVHVTGEFAISNWSIEDVNLSGGRADVPAVQIPHTQRCRFDLSGLDAAWPISIERSTRDDRIHIRAGRRAQIPGDLRGTRVHESGP